MFIEALLVVSLHKQHEYEYPTPAQMRALRVCESSNRTNAVSRTGKYRGLYQFDIDTWQSVGGLGDPARASRAEQNHRARLLYRSRGWEPWPHCGQVARNTMEWIIKD
jgi:hypothetical protein